MGACGSCDRSWQHRVLSVSRSAVKPVAQSPAPREALPLGEWETVRLRGSWRLGQTAGGSRNFASYPTNPCFPLSVPEGAGPRCIRISLQQDCQDGKCHPIGFHIFQASFSRWLGARGQGPGPESGQVGCGEGKVAQDLCPRRWPGVALRPGFCPSGKSARLTGHIKTFLGCIQSVTHWGQRSAQPIVHSPWL